MYTRYRQVKCRATHKTGQYQLQSIAVKFRFPADVLCFKYFAQLLFYWEVGRPKLIHSTSYLESDAKMSSCRI